MWCQLSIRNLLSFSLGGLSRFHQLKYVRSLSVMTKPQNAATLLFYLHQGKNKTLFFRRYCSKIKSSRSPKALNWRGKIQPASAASHPASGTVSSPLIVDMMKKNRTPHNEDSPDQVTSSLNVMKASINEMKWDFKALKHKKRMIIKTGTVTSSNAEIEDTEEPDGNTFVEEITLDEQKHKTTKHKGHPLKGNPDPSVAVTGIPCSGCGAPLHCQDTGIPGYMPGEKLKSLTRDELRSSLCQRCFLLQHYNMCLNVKVKEDELAQILLKIKNEIALVLVVVDLFDMRNSIVKDLDQHIGGNRPLYIIGNKVDMIPKDETGYLDRIKDTLLTECKNSGLLKSEKYCKHVCLVSAKTGYGIEELVTKLMVDWELKGSVYLVGSTNSGKSTLFNALLQSDYCKANVREAIHRATVSVWPGTTLSLLKFPIINPTPWRLAKRKQRVLKSRQSHVEEELLRKKRLKSEGRSKNATLIGYVSLTDFRSDDSIKQDKERDEDNVEIVSYELKKDGIVSQYGRNHTEEEKKLMKGNMFQMSKWFFDTPGVVNSSQLINLLTQDELFRVIQKGLIKPRPFILPPNQVMFVSGLGRLDYIQGEKSIVVTVHTSSMLPVHIVKSEEADTFYKENVGTDILGVPLGDGERLSALPPLVGKEYYLNAIDMKTASADIQLSSLGWVSFCIPRGLTVGIKAYVPGGKGCSIREPALLPSAKVFRGPRIRGTAMYKLPKPVS